VAGLPIFSADTHAPSLYVLPGIAIGVTGSAFLMTAVTQGKAGVRRLVQRLLWWRVGLQWFAVAVLLIPVSEIVASAALGNPDALRALTPSALMFYPAAYVSHFFFGPLFEESGWRGFALPRIQGRFGPFRGTLLLGLLWSGWHFFLYLPASLAGGAAVAALDLGVFTFSTTAMTFIFTWLSNNTKASLLLAILLHRLRRRHGDLCTGSGRQRRDLPQCGHDEYRTGHVDHVRSRRGGTDRRDPRWPELPNVSGPGRSPRPSYLSWRARRPGGTPVTRRSAASPDGRGRRRCRNQAGPPG
jgi:membrane protease YdiL (CAAX protease family)